MSKTSTTSLEIMTRCPALDVDTRRMPSSTELPILACKASTFCNLQTGETSHINIANSTRHKLVVARLLMSTMPSTMRS